MTETVSLRELCLSKYSVKEQKYWMSEHALGIPRGAMWGVCTRLQACQQLLNGRQHFLLYKQELVWGPSHKDTLFPLLQSPCFAR